MQAKSVIIFDPPYVDSMQTGRPSKEPRTDFGQRLFEAREAAGLSQAEVAKQLGITQKAYAVWERYPVALRPKQIETVASVLQVSVEYLFGKTPKSRGKGPASKLRQVFQKASQLPRHQQNKVAEFVGAFVKQHANGTNGNS